MCGFVGFVNLKQELQKEKYKYVLNNILTDGLKHNNANVDIFSTNNIMLGYKKLIGLETKKEKQPMRYKFDNNTYTIVYNGNLYNSKDLRNELLHAGFSFTGCSDEEILLKSYIFFRK